MLSEQREPLKPMNEPPDKKKDKKPRFEPKKLFNCNKPVMNKKNKRKECWKSKQELKKLNFKKFFESKKKLESLNRSLKTKERTF